MIDTSAPIRATLREEGSLLHILLTRPRGNVIDKAMTRAIRACIAEHAARPGLRSILLEGEGKHFSFGASVEEHQPDQIEDMLPTFHALFRDLAASGRVLLAAVRGQCLGGGLELAAFCHRIVASPDTKLGNPEIVLGVFAPLASAVLPYRIGQPAADQLLLSGRTIDAPEALSLGLIDEIAEDPAAALLAWHRQHLARHSAASLAQAVRAARHRFHRDLFETLEALERQYLEELMATADAREGIAAFLEKRTPQWTHR